MLLADWCVHRRGVDPVAAYRGRFNSIEDLTGLVGVSSLPRVFGRLIRVAGMSMICRPVYGDLAMITVEDGGGPRGAIVGDGYIVLSKGVGLTRVPFSAARRVAAWSIDG
jgi:hypothetical protein